MGGGENSSSKIVLNTSKNNMSPQMNQQYSNNKVVDSYEVEKKGQMGKGKKL